MQWIREAVEGNNFYPSMCGDNAATSLRNMGSPIPLCFLGVGSRESPLAAVRGEQAAVCCSWRCLGGISVKESQQGGGLTAA